jgi:spoIIIJ-associated protein
VKDREFSGPDVEEALALAAASLGLPRRELRYVVLDKGSAGGRGLSATPARIAVLLQEPPAPGTPPARQAAPPRAAAAAPERDPVAGIRETLRAVAEAGGLELAIEIEDGEEALVVHLRGRDAEFFLEPDGRADVLRATEHLLLRLHGAAFQPRPLRITGDGFRERRDQALVEAARRLAAEVRQDGQPRTMPPLNSYERRVVHVALQGEPGVRSASTGEGAERRLTVSPAPPAAAPGPEAGHADE